MKNFIFSLALIFTFSSMAGSEASKSGPCAGARGAAHPNGGGFVARTAKVDATVIVGPEASVCDFAQVRGEAQILGQARIYGHVKVSGKAKIEGKAQIYGNALIEADEEGKVAHIRENARVYGNARLKGEVQLWGSAQVFGDAKLEGDIQASHNVQIYGRAELTQMVHLADNARVGGRARAFNVAICNDGPFEEGEITSGVSYCDGLWMELEYRPISPGKEVFVGLHENRLNAPRKVEILIEGAELHEDVRRTHLDINNEKILSRLDMFRIEGNRVITDYQLREGRNRISIHSSDNQGRALGNDKYFWVGTHKLQVLVVNESDQPLVGAEVTLLLADDQGVEEVRTTNASGIVEFENVPALKVLLSVKDGERQSEMVGVMGDSGEVKLTFRNNRPPSSIDNNDFSQGLDGWEVEGEIVELIPRPGHQDEGLKKNSKNFSDGPLSLLFRAQGEGTRTISRTFHTNPGVKAVIVYYRYWGNPSEAGPLINDSYSVLARSFGHLGVERDFNSAHVLGQSMLNSDGLSSRMALSVPVDPNGDIVQVDFSLSQLGGETSGPSLVIDGIDQVVAHISEFELRDSDPDFTPLQFFSAHPLNPYRSGRVELGGVLSFGGIEGDALDEVYLEVIQHGEEVARLELSQLAKQRLIGVDFGAEGVVSTRINDEEQFIKLFELNNEEAAKIDITKDGQVNLVLRARTQNQSQIMYVRRGGPLDILTRYHAASMFNRYSSGSSCSGEAVLLPLCRDDNPAIERENFGGDDWALPSIIGYMTELIRDISLSCNDFSNMNGGTFPPHQSHQIGIDVDCVVRGLPLRQYRRAVAVKLLQILRHKFEDGAYGYEVLRRIFVTYASDETDEFYLAIHDQTINSIPATDFIINEDDHETHFHLRFNENFTPPPAPPGQDDFGWTEAHQVLMWDAGRRSAQISVEPPRDHSITIKVGASGTILDDDYNLETPSVVIPAGQTTANVFFEIFEAPGSELRRIKELRLTIEEATGIDLGLNRVHVVQVLPRDDIGEYCRSNISGGGLGGAFDACYHNENRTQTRWHRDYYPLTNRPGNEWRRSDIGELDGYSLSYHNILGSQISVISQYSNDNLLLRYEVHENGQASRFSPYYNNKIHGLQFRCDTESIHTATLIYDEGNLVNWIFPEPNQPCPIELPNI